MVENVLYVTGGWNGSDYLTAILSWDPLQEKWTHAGDLRVARGDKFSESLPFIIHTMP